MKTNSIYIYINVYHINIKGWEKKIGKKIVYFEVLEMYVSNSQKLKV
jgi:hypothetical protein